MWIVTGGCGFIGTNFIHYISKDFHDIEIINLDKLTYAGNITNLKDVEGDSRYKFVHGDINDSSILSKIFSYDVDLVINFAAESHVDRSIVSQDEFIRTNINGTHLLLKFCRKFDSRFIQISTDEVYGSREKGYFKEEDPLNPSSVYSASKAAADMLVNAYRVTYGLDTNITRSSNNFGPFQYPEKLMSLFVTNLLTGKKLPVYGSGKNIRDWLFVEDNCRAIEKIIQKGKKGEIYNIGAGNEKNNLEIAHIFLSKFGYEKDMIKFVPDRPGHDFRYAVDRTKIHRLGWKTRISFEEALDLSISWYRNHEEWWRPLIIS